MKRYQQPSRSPYEHIFLAFLLMHVGKEQRQKEGACQEHGRSHIDMAQQVIAPTEIADTSVENSRKLRGARLRVRSSFVAVNVLDSIQNWAGLLPYHPDPIGLRVRSNYGICWQTSQEYPGTLNSLHRLFVARSSILLIRSAKINRLPEQEGSFRG